jgi:small-conductance mechanosensitive channel
VLEVLSVNENNSKRNIVKTLVYAVLLAAAAFIGVSTGLIKDKELKAMLSIDAFAIAKLIVMIFGVLLLKNLIVLILGFFKPKSHRARSIISLTSSLMKYLAFIVILCWGLTIIGVNITTIIASIGILALIVGFSAESLIADVVTGTFMLLENQYNVGDIVEINGFRGIVTSIGIRTTCITDSGDNVKIINNSEMKNILNRSDNSSRAVGDISIPYETDLTALEKKLPALMQEIYDRNSATLNGLPVYLGVQALEASGILLRFIVEVDEKNIFSAGRLLNRELLLGFKKLGIECPYTRLDVHTV